VRGRAGVAGLPKRAASPNHSKSPAGRTARAAGEVEDRLRRALAALELAQQQERIVIAAELHDGPMQHLALFGYTLDLVDRRLASGQLDEAIEMLRAVRSGLTREMGALRRVMCELCPPVHDERRIDVSVPDDVAGSETRGGAGAALSAPTGAVPLVERGASRPLLTLIDNHGHRIARSPRVEMPKVLVVDDEPIVRGVLVALLTEHDFDVVAEAADGVEAVELCERLAPDLVVMDMKMPAMDGKEATRLIRAHRPSSQVVLLSGDGSRVALADCLAVGAFDVLAKGGPAGALCETLDRAWRLGREHPGSAA
jgi:CheY-like chemotaxis protein